MSDLKLVIFDVDGTLVDSQNDIFGAMQLAFSTQNLPIHDRQAALSIVGLSLPEAMRVLAPQSNDDQRARLVESYKEAYVALRSKTGAGESSPLYPGVQDMLADLSRRTDVLLAVATGKSRRGLDKLIDAHGLKGFFVSEQVADHHPSKPNPSMVHACLSDAGVTAQNAVVIGDTEFDMDMAFAANVTGIGVLWGYHGRNRLGRATTLLESVEEIIPTLHRMWSLSA